MNPLAIAALMSTLGGPPAEDDGLTPPKEMPAIYRAECGSCHVPYPPNLLAAGGFFSGDGWRAIMRDLKSHFGDNASLEEPVREQIEQYVLERAGASDRRFGSRSDPPRLTTTLWFHRNHGRMKSRFSTAAVGSPANCQACHPNAEAWSFDKTEITVPDGPAR